ncbi:MULTISPECIES: DUF4148 domain-containing protein [unclassified Paraburkholderia]|uniref:DUF4148 domain-containing protein n=1 Tax=unclassified Paraburkholderia TaxID=2615204 RepID=UPI002AB6DACF|nr:MULTISPECIES: DUF4148 domain-containing protein [unclassified Paraburkholderia]
MKPTLFSCLLAAVLAAPAAAFSQSIITRAQVRDQLVTFESAAAPGAPGDAHYPDDVLAAANGGAKPATASRAFGDQGGVAAGSSEAGRRAQRAVSGDVSDVPGLKPIYFGQ